MQNFTMINLILFYIVIVSGLDNFFKYPIFHTDQ